MTGESLMNNSFGVIGKQVAQGSVVAVDRLMDSSILEVLIGIVMFILAVYLIKKGYEKGSR